MPTEKIKRMDIKGPRLSNLSIPYKRIPIALGSVLAGCNCALGPNDVFYHQTGPPIPSSLLPWPLHPSSSACLTPFHPASLARLSFPRSSLPQPTTYILSILSLDLSRVLKSRSRFVGIFIYRGRGPDCHVGYGCHSCHGCHTRATIYGTNLIKKG